MAGLASQVSMDAAPSTPTGNPFSARDAMVPSSGPSIIDVDAVAGPEDASRRNTASLMLLAAEQEARQVAAQQEARQWGARPPVAREQQPLDTIHYGQPVSKESSHIPFETSHLRELDIKFKNVDISGSYDDSSYGSLSSMELCSSTPSDDWQDELRKYEKDMPPEIRMGNLDVLILYHEDDRDKAEVFRQHLMTEIDVENGPIKTMLYDDPEMVAICGSHIGHLDQAVQRSTYVFIYMTKAFVSDKWCEFQSESCLMEAITNPKKMWCVVPVYTEKRNKTFRVPMGLNTLKGVNYYNNDKFYRKGVSRLIGDKICVRIQADEDHRTKQKVWLEEHKRKQLVQREMMRRSVAYAEEQTRKAEEWVQRETENLIKMGVLPPTMQHSASENDIPRNPPVLHHSQSVNSLKQVHPQNPAVAEYFQGLLHQQKTQGYNFASYTPEELLNIQRVFAGTSQSNALHGHHINPNYLKGQTVYPPVENSANYMHNHHSVNRTNSQPVGDMKLSSNSQIRNEFSDYPVELLKKIQHMSPSEQEHHKQEFLKQLQDHRISMHHHQQQQNNMLAQQDQNNLASVQQDMQNSVVSQHDSPHRSVVQHTMPAFDQLNSTSSVGSGSLRSDSLSNSASVSDRGGFSSSYQSSDRSRQASQNLSPGNLPNNSLLFGSHETDGGPSSPALRDTSNPMSRAPEKQEHVGKLSSSDSDSEKDKMSAGRKKKEKKVVKHVTINVYQAQNVQIGDHNLANQKEIVRMSNSSDDDDESVLTSEDVSPKEKTTVNTRSSQRMKKVDIPSGTRSHAELGPQTVAGPCTVDAAPSTVADVRNMSFKPDVQPEHGSRNGETQHGTDIKGMTFPKHQVDITVEEAEEVQEEEPNSSGEKCSNSSKVDVFQQSSKSVESSQKFEGSVNINSSESEKSTAKSLQKDIKVFSVPAKPIARTKPQVAHIAPIVHDPPNDNVDVTCVKTVVDTEYTERKVPVVSHWLDDDRSQTFVKGVAPVRHMAANSAAESMQREYVMPNNLQTKSNDSLDKCCQDDLKSTSVAAARFSVGRSANAHQLFYQRHNKSSSVDPEGEHIGQREATLDDSNEQKEIIEEGDATEFEIINRDDHPLNQASSSMEESGKLVESRRWQPRGSKKKDNECHIS